MERYKFKGKRKGYKRWAHWDLLEGLPKELDPDTVCMGLETNDDFGNLIYEEDIVKISERSTHVEIPGSPFSVSRKKSANCGRCGYVYGWEASLFEFTGAFRDSYIIQVIGNRLY